MEPVEIDIRMKQNVESESEKAVQGINNITVSSKAAVQAAKDAVAEQKSVIKQIESDMASIEKQLSKAAPGNAKDDLVRELQSAKQALAEEKAALGDYSAKVDEAANATRFLRSQVMEAKDALAKMEMQGKRGTPEYAAQAKVLGDLNDQMQDTNAQAKILADDQKGFKAVSGAVSVLTGAMTAGVGVAAAFGAKDEDLARIQTRLQAVMAITIGLEQVANALDKDQYFNVVLVTKAKQGWASAQTFLNTQLGISIGLSRALMLTGIGLLIAGIGTLIYLYTQWSDKEEERKKIATESAKVQKELSESISKGYAEEQSKIQAMRTALDSESVSRFKKLDIIKKLKEQIPGYTAALDKEGNIIRENKKAIDNYMVSLEKSLRLRAAEKELATIYEKKFNLEKLVIPEEKAGGQFAIKKEQTPEQKLKQQISDGAKAGIALLEADEKRIKDRIEAGGLVDIKNTKETKEKVAKEKYDAEKAIQKLIIDINSQTSKLRIQQQEDSLQKRLAQIDLERDEEIRKITEKETAIVDAYNKAHKDDKGFVAKTSVSAIDPLRGAELTTAKGNVTDAYSALSIEATKKWGEELNKLALQFADERVQIETDYNEKIKQLSDAKLYDAWGAAVKERDDKISAVSKGLLEETSLYKMATGDQLMISKALTENLIAEMRKRIEADKTLTAADKTKLLAELNKADLTVQKTDNPFSDLMDGLAKYKKAREEQSNTNAATDIENFARLEDAANKAQKATLEAAAGGLQGIASIIKQVVDELKSLTDAEKKAVDEVIGMISGAATLAQGIATNNPVSIIQGALELSKNAYVLFDAEANAIQKRQTENKNAVDELEKAYTALDNAIKNAYSTDKVRLIAEENANLEAKKKLVEDSKQAEIAKSKKLKWYEYLSPALIVGNLLNGTDQGEIDKYNKELDEINQQIADNNDALVESLIGTSVSSAIDDFANAYADAFTTGEDSALKSAEVVKNILKKALVEDLKKDLKKPIDELMTMVADAMSLTSDGGAVLTDSEKAAILLKQKELDEIAAANQNAFESLGLGDSSRTGASKGIATASQDSVDEYNGNMYAMRLTMADMRNIEKEQLLIQQTMTGQLSRIADNTEYCKYLKDMAKDINDMKVVGIKVKV